MEWNNTIMQIPEAPGLRYKGNAMSINPFKGQESKRAARQTSEMLCAMQ